MSSSTAAHLILDEDDLSLGNLSFGECDDGFFAGLGSTSLDSSSSSLQSLKPVSGDGGAPQSPSLLILPPAKSSIGMSSMSTAAPPRMVSVESMSQVAASPLKKASKPTHLQSLKDLVSKKQQRQQKEPTKSNKRSLCESRIASIFEKPSLALQQVLEQQQQHSPAAAAPQEEPVLKKRKIDTSLHEACRRPQVSVAEIEDLLVQDPTAAARPATLTTCKRMYNPLKCQLEDNPKTVPETYRYPLNLAIQYQASAAVLERLVAAAPQVLTTPDSNTISLHILIRHKPTDQTTADMMLLKQPTMASWRDVKGNTALHQAVQHGAGEQMIRHLTILEPAALLQRNWHGQTPLDLAQRTGRVCNQDAADYLWTQTQEQF